MLQKGGMAPNNGNGRVHDSDQRACPGNEALMSVHSFIEAPGLGIQPRQALTKAWFGWTRAYQRA
jgi:hypothetical protein